MNTKDILEQALSLKPQDKSSIIEGLLISLDEPSKTLEQIWTEEAGKRLKAYRENRLEGIDMEEVFEK